MRAQIPCVSTISGAPRHKLAITLLASGSKGNAILISAGEAAVLIDAGLSGIAIERRMRARGICPTKLQAVIVSHEHADHLQGVGILSRRYRIPVYINPKTAMAAKQAMGNLFECRHFECGAHFAVGSMMLHPFSTSHDAADPAGFTLSCDGVKIGIATDLGIGTAMVKRHLAGCDFLVLEANHDAKMLIEGPYPWPLKQRIKGRTGHLSNEDARQLLSEIVHDRLRHVMLAHLSETNNLPDLALGIVSEALAGCRAGCSVAGQDVGSEVFLL